MKKGKVFFVLLVLVLLGSSCASSKEAVLSNPAGTRLALIDKNPDIVRREPPRFFAVAVSRCSRCGQSISYAPGVVKNRGASDGSNKAASSYQGAVSNYQGGGSGSAICGGTAAQNICINPNRVGDDTTANRVGDDTTAIRVGDDTTASRVICINPGRSEQKSAWNGYINPSCGYTAPTHE